MKIQREIFWDEDITERRPVTSPPGATGFYAVTVGKRRVKAVVQIDVDIDAVASRMGKRAAMNKSRKTKQGLMSVKCLNVFEESRRMFAPDADDMAAELQAERMADMEPTVYTDAF